VLGTAVLKIEDIWDMTSVGWFVYSHQDCGGACCLQLHCQSNVGRVSLDFLSHDDRSSRFLCNILAVCNALQHIIPEDLNRHSDEKLKPHSSNI